MFNTQNNSPTINSAFCICDSISQVWYLTVSKVLSTWKHQHNLRKDFVQQEFL